jgi:Flp pilus assembly protein TadD
LKSDHADAHNNLGITLRELGKLEEAEASYTQAIALKPDFAAAHANLGDVLLKKGLHREGLNEILIGAGAISFDVNNGLSIL